MKQYLIQTEQLTVGYDGIPLIRDIAIRVKSGEILTLIGPNGAGKSTILKSILRQLPPLGGTVYLDGRSMHTMTSLEIAQQMAAVLTERIQPELMTCGDVVSTGRYPYTRRLGILSAADTRKVHEALALVHASELFHEPFAQLSDGQRQRVLLARAICQEPQVIVLDEPTSYLDIRYKLELSVVLKQMAREKKMAVILSLHELDLAMKLSDHILCIRQGAANRYGPPEEIFSGGYIRELYSMTTGSYQEAFGSLELPPVQGTPEVFVIAGNGSGLPVFRKLQRDGVPFATGILYENDIDCQAAAALAATVLSSRAFYPIPETVYQKALTVLQSCKRVICCLQAFGPFNHANERLARYAQENGLLFFTSCCP